MYRDIKQSNKSRFFKLFRTFTLLIFFFFPPKPHFLSERKLVESSRKVSSRPKPLSILRSLEEKYVAAMKKLQFGECIFFFEMFVQICKNKTFLKHCTGSMPLCPLHECFCLFPFRFKAILREVFLEDFMYSYALILMTSMTPALSLSRHL